MKYELLALYEEFKDYIYTTVQKSWREEWEDYFTLPAFMEWLANKVKPVPNSSEESTKLTKE